MTTLRLLENLRPSIVRNSLETTSVGRFSRPRSPGVPKTPSRLSPWRSRFSRSKPAHLRLGALGEKMAARHLRRQGFKILFRNFRGRQGGEIDLVARDRDTLVFVEVKTRTREDFGRPREAVDLEN